MKTDYGHHYELIVGEAIEKANHNDPCDLHAASNFSSNYVNEAKSGIAFALASIKRDAVNKNENTKEKNIDIIYQDLWNAKDISDLEKIIDNIEKL